jgi:L-fuconate dehydratase
MSRITHLDTYDVRFPTSRELDGSDAVNVDPDYSAAYVVLRTDADDGHEGHGFAFTCGRGTEVQVATIDAFAPFVVGLDVEEVLADTHALSRSLTGESQLRWLGPEKGVVHMAVAAIVNAVWDLWAKREGKPLWKLLADLSPEEIVAMCDFTYLTDAITQDEALALLTERAAGRAEREQTLRERGLPAYTTSPGWLGYDDDKLRRLTAEALADGFTQIKLKVGADLDDDIRRCGIAREVMGPEPRLCIDANQAWDVPTAIAHVNALADFDITWIEEPTSCSSTTRSASARSTRVGWRASTRSSPCCCSPPSSASPCARTRAASACASSSSTSPPSTTSRWAASSTTGSWSTSTTCTSTSSTRAWSSARATGCPPHRDTPPR